MSKVQKLPLLISCLALLISVSGYFSSLHSLRIVEEKYAIKAGNVPFSDDEKLFYDGPRVNLSAQAEYERIKSSRDIDSHESEKNMHELHELYLFKVDPENGLLLCTEFIVGDVRSWSTKLSYDGNDYMLQFADNEFVGYLKARDGLSDDATDVEKFVLAEVNYDYETRKILLEEYKAQVDALLHNKNISI